MVRLNANLDNIIQGRYNGVRQAIGVEVYRGMSARKARNIEAVLPHSTTRLPIKIYVDRWDNR